MMKTKGRVSAWTVAIIGAVATVAVSATIGLMGSAAHAQTGWGSPAAEDDAAKKPPPPPPLGIAGTWNGTIDDSKAGPGTVSLTFTEKASKTKGTLKGTWLVSYPQNGPEGAINDVGTITGSVVGSAVAITLVPRKGDALGNCKLIFNSTQATADSIMGTFHFSVCSGGNTGTIALTPGAAPTTVFINVASDFFFPTKVTINRGQTVRWTNNSVEVHSVNANPGTEKCKPVSGESFDSPPLPPATIFERAFNNSGTFAYHCEIHGCMMKGTIIVN
jgi:plastocyanin